jgi:ssDNA-binding Zn-finger/Zn-ribbon topoisomerase 1
MKTHLVKCPKCSAEMNLRSTLKFGPKKWFYSCPRWPVCNGSHGAHDDGRPLGIPADDDLKALRIKGHDAFERCRRIHKLTRSKMYHKLARLLNIPRSKCHFGMFDTETCTKAIQILEELC